MITFATCAPTTAANSPTDGGLQIIASAYDTNDPAVQTERTGACRAGMRPSLAPLAMAFVDDLLEALMLAWGRPSSKQG